MIPRDRVTEFILNLILIKFEHLSLIVRTVLAQAAIIVHLHCEVSEVCDRHSRSIYMTLTAGNKRSLQEGISTLPDELLRGILTLVDFNTKVQGHAVCRKWNEILGNPCVGNIWAEVPAFTMTSDKLSRETRQQILQYTEW